MSGPVHDPHTPRRAGAVAWCLLVVNLALLAGQNGFGKQASLHQADASILTLLRNPWYLITMVCLAAQALIWPVVLRRVPLGFAYGFNSLAYINTLLISRFVFHEQITVNNLIGVALIMAGVLLWARGEARRA